jgi:hypothetical protein
MCDIPLDLERTFERRWAARFSGPAKEHRLQGQQQHQLVTASDEKQNLPARTGGPRSTDIEINCRPEFVVFASRGAS